MNKILFFGLIAVISVGCNNNAPTQINSNSSVVSSSSPRKDDMTATSHSLENQKPPIAHGDEKPDAKGNSKGDSGGGSPNSRAIDVSQMTAEIEKAEKEYKAKPDDEKAKTALAIAYFARATALTNAAQYKAALGDYRKGLKLTPNDQDAKGMHDQIISIFEMLGRTPPKEGEEPGPLPLEKK